jgi:drug/metabolite transporter (DMT)-like permease
LRVQIVLVVLAAGVLHAVWNAIAKQLTDQLIAFALIGVAATAIGGGLLIFTGLPYKTAIPFACGSAVLHIAYEAGLMSSYKLGAFNQTYPIARGTSPLVVAVGAYVFANERLPFLATCGIVILATGIVTLALSSGKLSRADRPAVIAAVLTGLAIASYTLVDGLGVRHSHHDPYAYGALLFLLQGPVFPLVALKRRTRRQWGPQPIVIKGLLAGAISLVAYGAVLWAQTKAPLAEVAALRETSVISAALIGTFVFKERFGRKRVTAAVLVATGIILIAV